jgi:hypothetical protein
MLLEAVVTLSLFQADTGHKQLEVPIQTYWYQSIGTVTWKRLCSPRDYGWEPWVSPFKFNLWQTHAWTPYSRS